MVQAADERAGIEFKPVFGDGRERRWRVFKEIFEGSCIQDFGGDLMRNAEDRRDLKYRLLKVDNRDAGILIYRSDLSNGGQKLRQCLEVELIHVNDPTKNSRFLREIISLARDKRASSLCIAAAANNDRLHQVMGRLSLQALVRQGKSPALRFFSCQLQQRGAPPPAVAPAQQREKRPREEIAAPPKARDRKRERKVDRCPIRRQYFNLIRNGRKTVEGRINSHPFNHWEVGQTVEFFCGQDAARCQIVAITAYPSFRAMLEGEGVQACLPNVRSVDAGAEIYRRIPRYEEKAQRHGVLGIKLKRV